MPYANERRKPAHEPADELSPEFVAMLVLCGGEVRESDRAEFCPPGGERNFGRRSEDWRPSKPEVRRIR